MANLPNVRLAYIANRLLLQREARKSEELKPVSHTGRNTRSPTAAQARLGNTFRGLSDMSLTMVHHSYDLIAPIYWALSIYWCLLTYLSSTLLISSDMTIQGERIHTIEQMLDALEKSDASEKYDIALFCYGKLISAHDLLGDGICRLFDYVSSAELWKGHHDTQE